MLLNIMNQLPVRDLIIMLSIGLTYIDISLLLNERSEGKK